MTTWALMDFIAAQTRAGRKVALLILTEKTGSAPGVPGQIMAVLEDGTSCGTIGGGAAEHRMVARAVQAISGGETTFSFALDLAESGMICGGSLKGIGNILGVSRRLLLFGGGHVAQAITPLARSIGLPVTVVEDREDLEVSFVDVEFLLCPPDRLTELVRIGPEDFVVICTRGHLLDYEALRFCLDSPCKYLGMIGSKKKVAGTLARLRENGVPQRQLDRVYAPVGLDISDGTPAEIAISVMAEILLVKNGGSLKHRRLAVNAPD